MATFNSNYNQQEQQPPLLTDTEKMNVDDPPFLPECDVFEEWGPNAQQRFLSCDCKDKFVPVNEFSLNDIPPKHRHMLNMTQFQNICARTVKLTVLYTSENRPDAYLDSTAPYPYAEIKRDKRKGRCGTGFIYDRELIKITGERCPCPECKASQSPKMEFIKIRVGTAALVVFDDSEAEKTVCEVFYDNENKDSVQYFYGVKCVDEEYRGLFDNYDTSFIDTFRNELFFIECVNHDVALYDVIRPTLCTEYSGMTLSSVFPIMVSHPHGGSKQISIGSYWHYSLKFSPNHSPNTPYTIPIGTWVHSEMDVVSHFPGFFERCLNRDTSYRLSHPLKVNLTCDSSQTTTVFCDAKQPVFANLPKHSILSSMDGLTEFPIAALKFGVFDLLPVFSDNDTSYQMIYETPTCKGCSGAFVLSCYMSHGSMPCHFGKLSSGENCSSNYRGWW